MQSSRQRATQSVSRLLVSRSVQSRKAVLAAAIAALAAGGTVRAADFVYTPAGSTDSMSSGTNWSATPVSAVDTTLTIVGDNTTVQTAAQISETQNDIGNFSLNILNLQGTGAASGGASQITISNGTLNFISNGGLDPVINLNALNGTAGVNYIVSSALNLANNTTITGSGNANFTISGNIAGAGGLTKSGSSTVVLSGANTYSGNTAITAGVLQVNSAAALSGYNSAGKVSMSGGTLRLMAGGTTQWGASQISSLLSNGNFSGGSIGLTVDSGNTFAYGSAITQPIGLIKAGTGTVVLSGSNSYTGGTSITNGVLIVSSDSNLGAAGGTVSLNGGVLQINGNSITSLDSRNVNWATINGGINVASASNTITSASGLGGAGNFTKWGAGTLSLQGASSHTGATTINGGVLDLGTAGAPGTGALTVAGGELRVAGSSAGPKSMSVGTLNANAFVTSATASGGRAVVTLVADPSQPITLTASALAARSYGATTLYRGTNLGSAVSGTPGVANILFASAPAAGNDGITSSFAATGGGGVNTTEAPVLRGALADTSATGNGSAFATYEAGFGVRPLKTSEQVTTYPGSTSNDNVRLNLTGAAAITGVTTNTLQLDNTSGSAQTVTNTGTLLVPAHGLLFSGNSPITLTGGSMLANTRDLVILSTNTSAGGATISSSLNASSGSGQRGYTFGGPGLINVTSAIAGGSVGGIAVNGPGTVNFTGTTLQSSGFGVNVAGGTLKLGTTTVLGTSSGFSGTRPWRVSGAGTLDLNGANLSAISATANTIDFLADLNGSGGTITNTNASASTLTVSAGTTTSGTFTFSGTITGNVAVVRSLRQGSPNNSTMTQVLSGANTYTGPTIVNGGTLMLGRNDALPTNTALNVNGNTVSGTTVPGVLNLAGFNQTVGSLAGTTSSLAAYIENDTPGTTSVLTVGGSASTTYANTLRDNAGTGGTVALAKSGSGILTLTGSNTYTGGTTITGGTLRANNTSGSATGTGPVNINSGGTLDGIGSVGGTVIVNSGGKFAPGNSVGSMTVDKLTTNSGGNIDVEFSLSSNDFVTVTANNGLTINGGSLNLFQENTSVPFSAPGTYNLFQLTGAVQGSGTLSVSNPQFGRSYVVAPSGGFLTLTITSTIVTSNWTDGANNGLWSDTGNWSAGVPNSQGAIAAFGGAISAPRTVNLGASRTVGEVNFDNASNAYTLAGGTLTMDNSTANAAINNVNGNHFISSAVALNGNTIANVVNASETLSISGNISGAGNLTKSGAGTLVLSGNNTHARTVVGAGIVAVSADAPLGTGSTLINAGTLAVTSSFTTARTIQVGNAASTIDVASAQALQLDGTVSDGPTTGTLKKTGTGTLIINGSVSATGGTNVSEGVLQLGTTGGSTGSLGSGPVAIASGAAIVAQRPNATITGAVSGAGTIRQNVTGGTLTLSGSNSAFTGVIEATASNVVAAHTNGIGGATVNLNNATLTQSTSSNIYNGGTLAGGFSKLVLTGSNTLNTGGSTMTVGAELSGDATTSITRTGASTLALGVSGNNNFSNASFSGTFTNSTGTLLFASRGAGSATAKWVFNGGPVLLNNLGGSINLGYIEGSSSISLTSGSGRFSVGGANLSGSYSADILTGGGNLGFAKVGNATLTLSGQNTFAGNDGVTFSTSVSTDTTWSSWEAPWWRDQAPTERPADRLVDLTPAS